MNDVLSSINIEGRAMLAVSVGEGGGAYRANCDLEPMKETEVTYC